jgi:hypothetical protein
MGRLNILWWDLVGFAGAVCEFKGLRVEELN